MPDSSRSKPRFSRRIPDGDDRCRRICDRCGWIDYENPRIVVGSVCAWQDRYLLCRRAIEPRAGFWTIPAGFLEKSESTEEGARRETIEEASAEIELRGLLGIYEIPRIHQVQLIYRAVLLSPRIAAGAESQEVRLMEWDAIPWRELAFPSSHWALLHEREAQANPGDVPHRLVLGECDEFPPPPRL